MIASVPGAGKRRLALVEERPETGSGSLPTAIMAGTDGTPIAEVDVSQGTVHAIFVDATDIPVGAVAEQLVGTSGVDLPGKEYLCGDRVTLRFDGIPVDALAEILADACSVEHVALRIESGPTGAFKSRRD